MSILYILFMYIILIHGLFHNQLVDISMGEANQDSHDDVQPSYMSDNSEAIEERYKNAKELLRLAKIGMRDAKLACSRKRARKQSNNIPPLTTSIGEDKDEDGENMEMVLMRVVGIRILNSLSHLHL